MEHPLINNIDHLSVEELHTRINDLVKKIGIAHRMGNAQLVGQIQMALETYQTKYREKQQAIWDESRRRGNDYSDKIDIS